MMEVVSGVEELRPEHGPIFAVIGVFDGLHLGHVYLLDHLVAEAAARDARPCVITFDAHPDEVLTGAAPPLLIHPDERLERLATAGIEVTVVQHFDETVRRTTYEAFIDMIRSRTTLAGILMTPDAAFGFERRGTPAMVAALGEEVGFDVVVVPPFAIDDRAVRSTDIRAAIRSGDLRRAAVLLGRPVTMLGDSRDGVMVFPWPVTLPPDGSFRARLDATETTIEIRDGRVLVPDLEANERAILELLGD
jgi:riboflavin kinase / FMN adenylyltransferase